MLATGLSRFDSRLTRNRIRTRVSLNQVSWPVSGVKEKEMRKSKGGPIRGQFYQAAHEPSPGVRYDRRDGRPPTPNLSDEEEGSLLDVEETSSFTSVTRYRAAARERHAGEGGRAAPRHLSKAHNRTRPDARPSKSHGTGEDVHTRLPSLARSPSPSSRHDVGGQGQARPIRVVEYVFADGYPPSTRAGESSERREPSRQRGPRQPIEAKAIKVRGGAHDALYRVYRDEAPHPYAEAMYDEEDGSSVSGDDESSGSGEKSWSTSDERDTGGRRGGHRRGQSAERHTSRVVSVKQSQRRRPQARQSSKQQPASVPQKRSVDTSARSRRVPSSTGGALPPLAGLAAPAPIPVHAAQPMPSVAAPVVSPYPTPSPYAAPVPSVLYAVPPPPASVPFNVLPPQPLPPTQWYFDAATNRYFAAAPTPPMMSRPSAVPGAAYYPPHVAPKNV